MTEQEKETLFDVTMPMLAKAIEGSKSIDASAEVVGLVAEDGIFPAKDLDELKTLLNARQEQVFLGYFRTELAYTGMTDAEKSREIDADGGAVWFVIKPASLEIWVNGEIHTTFPR